MNLKNRLDKHNVFAKSFRMTKERFTENDVNDLRLKLILDTKKMDGRIYNLLIVSEVTTLIVGDEEIPMNRDIILET